MKTQTSIMEKLILSAERHEKDAEHNEMCARAARIDTANYEELAAESRALAAEFRRVAALV